MDVVLLIFAVLAACAAMSYFLKRFIFKREVTSQEIRVGFLYLFLLISVVYFVFDMMRGIWK